MIPAIGIVGGAGPAAGFELCQRIVGLYQSRYRFKADSDFPRILVESYPFSDMLGPSAQIGGKSRVREELHTIVDRLFDAGAQTVALACNTLSCFLEGLSPPPEKGFLELLTVTADALESCPQPLVFCTTTSRHWGIHERAFGGKYPSLEVQIQVDRLIDRVLAGECRSYLKSELEALTEQCRMDCIVLGCTELSLLWEEKKDPRVVDPLSLLAEAIVLGS